MIKVRVPDKLESQIIRANGMDPRCYGVTIRHDNCIQLLNYKTRDNVTIHKGDRPWKLSEE